MRSISTPVIVAAAPHPADEGDTTTIAGTVAAAETNLAQVSAVPRQDKPSELVADKGYHSRAILKDLNAGLWKTRIAEPKQSGFSRWHGDDKARAAVYANRTRLSSGVGKEAMRRRAEIVERSFAHNLDIAFGQGFPRPEARRTDAVEMAAAQRLPVAATYAHALDSSTSLAASG